MLTYYFSLYIKVWSATITLLSILIFQFPIGLFDCNETKTADIIELLSDLKRKYVPQKNQ